MIYRHLILEGIKPIIENSFDIRTNFARIRELVKKLRRYEFPRYDYMFYLDLDREDSIQLKAT